MKLNKIILIIAIILSVIIATVYFLNIPKADRSNNLPFQDGELLKVNSDGSISRVSMPQKKVSLKECSGLSDENNKFNCSIKLAIESKDRDICRKLLGNVTAGYYCESIYDEQNGVNTDISKCQSMIGNDPTSSFYKDSCYGGVAYAYTDKEDCKNMPTLERVNSCQIWVEEKQHMKNDLCGPLFEDNKIPNGTDCNLFASNLHSIKICNTITPEWAKQQCLDYNKSFDKVRYDLAKSSSKKANTEFGKLIPTTSCESLEKTPIKCEASVNKNELWIKINSNLDLPSKLSKKSTEFNDCKIISQSISGGDYFDVQVERREDVVVHIQCEKDISQNKFNVYFYFSPVFGGINGRNVTYSIKR